MRKLGLHRTGFVCLVFLWVIVQIHARICARTGFNGSTTTSVWNPTKPQKRHLNLKKGILASLVLQQLSSLSMLLSGACQLLIGAHQQLSGTC